MIAPASIRTFTILGVAMKRCASLIFLLVSVLMMSGRAAAADSEAAESVVQAPLNAYNACDVDAFLATYSDEIEVYDFPASLQGQAGTPAGKPEGVVR
jgi:hypothetical protein